MNAKPRGGRGDRGGGRQVGKGKGCGRGRLHGIVPQEGPGRLHGRPDPIGRHAFTTRLATRVCRLRHDQMGQGPIEPRDGHSTFLLSSGGAGGGYY